jgi:hypothetical protein
MISTIALDTIVEVQVKGRHEEFDTVFIGSRTTRQRENKLTHFMKMKVEKLKDHGYGSRGGSIDISGGG